MTRLVNAPMDPPAKALRGFVPADKHYVKLVYGGVVRSTAIPQGKAAAVYGGGLGHYLALAGWMGAEIADDTVYGSTFSSPSGAQAYSVLEATDRGAGVLIGFGNYTGDVLHFGQTIERLRSEGIPVDTLVVTDDIASDAKNEFDKRRGIAGDFPALKIARATAEASKDFEEVKRIFAETNVATRSFGVASSGHTLSGADDPLFTVPADKMGVDLDVHGELGVSEDDLDSVDDVAATLVEGLLGDRPGSAGNRVIAVVNGLGNAKCEELSVIVGSIIDHLKATGAETADAESGEFVTSLNMAGVSLTLVWVDDEFLPYRDAPCDTPACRRGSVGEAECDDAELNSATATIVVTEKGSESSREAAGVVVGLLEKVLEMLEKSKDELGKLGSIAGDGDHGIGMANGSKAAAQAARAIADRGASVATTLSATGDAWSDHAGGTSGTLQGSLLTAIDTALGNEEAPSLDSITDAVIARRSAVQGFGGAQVGDKTMVDALVPLVDTFVSTDGSPKAKGEAAVAAGRAGTESTAQLIAKLGRA